MFYRGKIPAVVAEKGRNGSGDFLFNKYVQIMETKQFQQTHTSQSLILTHSYYGDLTGYLVFLSFFLMKN